MTPVQQQNYEATKKALERALEKLEENKDKIRGVIAIVGMEGGTGELNVKTWTEGEVEVLPWMFLEAGRSLAVGLMPGGRIDENSTTWAPLQ